ncbi:unnamed protein product [Nezara viridula]|uniref:U3 small nucleolar RNA-associated protein 14 homolog A n=1 Tax=Nezara viridula TaxID=85310 RepID=A0A9P0HS70_NEZVI|nr:unnamed protein product [Nezara viridula]
MAVNAKNVKFQEEEEGFSDEEVSEDVHQELVNAVANLYPGKKRIDPAKFYEPAQNVTEFKIATDLEEQTDDKLTVVDLAGADERLSRRYTANKIRNSLKTSKKLPKPLERIEEQKIERELGYDKVKKQLNKWSSIVERNKLASQLVFPLPSTQKINEKSNTYSFLTTFKEPTELEKEMAKVLDQSAIAQKERKEEEKLSKLTIEEMIERRNMTAKMRARESYRISKAIRQNKIKSKKFHRILKKDKIKQELKDFEKLQKTDPEAALEKLEQIERARAEERISLRHRNTGKWARSKAIRAKYDTEARIQLAEQLAKSRDLTRKIKDINNSSSEDESEDENTDEENNRSKHIKNVNENGTSDNPWVSEYSQFLDGYKTFSTENTDPSSDKGTNQSVSPQKNNENKNLPFTPSLNVTDSPSKPVEDVELDIHENQSKEAKNKDRTSKENKDGSQSEDEDEQVEEAINIDESNSDDDDDDGSKSSRKNASIDEMFDKVEEVLKDHVAVSVKRIESILKNDNDKDEDKERAENGTKNFEFKKSARLHDIDAALIEVADEGISSGLNDLSALKEKLNLTENKKAKEPQIDPNKLITVKPQKLKSVLPDLDEKGDDSQEEEEEEKEKHLNLMEAFAEDDIVDQFREEKKVEEKKSKGKEIDLTMPGWGSWAGTGVEKKSKRKTRRFIVKFPKVPRKDKKKPNVIINEDPVPKLREQLVSELPYPFTSVKDFEASIRAPIGKNWVTEKGFKKLTAPPVVTKMGTIIEPMDGSWLVNKPKKRMNNNKPNVNSKKKKVN